MKRKIALFLTVMLFVTMLVPVNIFAQADKELENAINKAKATFSIPSNYTEFNYNVNTEGAKKVWYLNWYRKDGIDGGMSVSVDDRGTITSYSFYKSYDYTQRSLPKLTRQEALVKAQEFIKKVNPQIADQIKYVPDTNQYGSLGIDYYMNFVRMEKGIPFPDNNVSVSVNVQTGEVQSYYMNWTDDLKFPEADKVISLEAAMAAYKEKLGLRLSYNRTYGSDDVKVYAAYLPRYNASYYIDALTGEKTLLSPYYGYGYGGAGDGMIFSSQKAAMNDSVMSPLSPEELKAVQEVSKLISQDEAEKKARAVKELGLTSEFKLSRASLSRSWEFKKNFFWDLSFAKETAQKDSASLYTNVTIDAITGEVRGFSLGLPYNEGAAKYDEAAAKAEVEKLLAGLMPEKFKNLEYQEAGRDYYILSTAGTDAPRYFNFVYTRKVNGIPFVANTLTVGFDAVNGKVTNLYMNWFDPEFPSVDKVVSLDSVYEKMFSEIGMELQYRFKYPEVSYDKMMPPIQAPNSKPEPVLVYSVKQGKPLSFDANTGAVIDSSGKVFKEFKPAAYTDISGHYAEKKIAALAEYGIALDGEKFRPNDQIEQLDFLSLLSKTLNYYTPLVIDSNSSAKEIDDLYAFLIREGVVLEGEKSPESPVTRENGVKFIIRALKYNKVADIKGIFNCSFKDSDKITPELYGYVAIAQGLKIVNGNDKGYFVPDAELTRAQAAVMIYNYLQK